MTSISGRLSSEAAATHSKCQWEPSRSQLGAGGRNSKDLSHLTSDIWKWVCTNSAAVERETDAVDVSYSEHLGCAGATSWFSLWWSSCHAAAGSPRAREVLWAGQYESSMPFSFPVGHNIHPNTSLSVVVCKHCYGLSLSSSCWQSCSWLSELHPSFCRYLSTADHSAHWPRTGHLF